MKKHVRLCSFACAAVMLFSVSLTGCTGGSVGSSQAASGTASTSSAAWDTSKQDTVTISVINNYYTAGEEQLAKDYMKLHPETKVVVDVVASNDAYMTKLKTTISTDINTAPDIVHGNFASAAFSGWAACYSKGYIMDLTSMLDETNEYNDNKKVRDVYDTDVITRAVSNAGGKLGFLPFDYCGVGFFYNKTIFTKLGLSAPSTFEDLISDCQTIQSNGYKTPIVAASESSWIQTMIADVAYRSKITDFLTLPGDAAYDESTMSQNSSIKYSADDPTFDLYAVLNDERIMAYVKKHGIVTKENKFVWSKFAELAKYFQSNWVSPDSQAVVTAFESQSSPIMITGSWDVGTLVNDISQLSSDKKFDWGTFSLPEITDNQGYTAKMRSLYVFGNCMSIVKKSDTDHEARVKDVMKYWYSPKVAQMMYDVTLSSGNLVQGPPAMNGVTLSDANSQYLNGFISKGTICQGLAPLVGQTEYLTEDQSKYNSICLKLSAGSLSVNDFLSQLNTIAMKKINSDIKTNGYDLDPKTADSAAS